MARRYYTDEEKAEILANPYTFRMTDTQVFFTLDFKKFVVKKKKEGLTSKQIFEKAAYSIDLFSEDVMRATIRNSLDEYNSKDGLKAPKMPKYSKSDSDKKHIATEIKELEDRVVTLEQTIEFLKKNHFVEKTGQKPSLNTT